MTPALAQLRERYLRAQLAGDRREAVRLLLEDGLGSGAQIDELQVHVIRAAQDEIGRLWQLNRVSIAQEHMATAISHLSLAALFERATPKPPLDERVLLACVEGELHELPARMVADALELEGFDVRYLGANVPTRDLVAAVQDERPDLIGLSVTMSFNLPALRTAVARVREVSDRPMFIGGHATRWSPGLARELDVTQVGDAELVATARRLVGVEP
ncbi:Methanogenic corrinoid protein MtbC1 [Nannocystis exedens]|uniref:Methanogenic corrinoid protein MtbC1 n=1 Tax=Nannocystis exedens TaxID=54 RepID=A0A1I1WGZ2_9BACT|nr:cobalamin-dependent protein [Nannocystis exedens]PCC67702.1 cobalamin-binding protein [Nannocystis exedens]SFD94271.1 Methanogenic corrinoid protein MtbC1 [Nannocystis exedens]